MIGKLMASLVTGVLVLAGCAVDQEPAGEGEVETATMAGPKNGSFIAELNGVPIHYEVRGTGPVIRTRSSLRPGIF